MRVVIRFVCYSLGLLGVIFPIAAFGDSAPSSFVPRNRPIDVQHYNLMLTVDPAKVGPKGIDQFEGVVTLKLKALQELEAIELDAQELVIQKAFWNGEPGPFKLQDNYLNVRLPQAAKKNTVGELKIHYIGKVNVEQSGLFRVTDPDAPERGTLLFTQLEAIHARQFFPCNDEPADKATMDIGATVPKGIDVISSGLLVSDKAVTNAGKPWHTVQWSLKQPHSTYLANIAIGPFSKEERLHAGKLPVSVYANKKSLKKADYVLETNIKAIAALEQYLHTPYPWPKYASVGLPTFVWGGMENTSTTFLNQDRMLLHDTAAEEEKFSIAILSAHELGHQWFGNLVTMRWWDDIWLNEAFASFASYKAGEALFSKEEMAINGSLYLWNEYFRQEDGPRSHAIVRKNLSSPSDAFDGISYVKGEQVLRMLEFYLGEEAFRKGMALYLKEFAFANANYTEFFAAMEKASGKDLRTFRDSWLLQRGYPVVSYHTEWDESDRQLKIAFQQKPNHASESYAFAFRLPVVFHRRTAPEFHQELTVEFSAKKKSTEILAALPAEPEWVTLNPQGVILTRVAVDSVGADQNTLSLQAMHDPDSVTRMWAVNELAKPLLDGKPLTKPVEDVIARCLLNDKSPHVRSGILNAFEKLAAKSLPATLSQAMVEAYAQTAATNEQWKTQIASDNHGWALWRTRLLRQLPKSSDPKAFALVASALEKKTSSLDEVASAAYAMASLGDKRSLPLLQRALTTQGKRGYRYKYWVQYALAAIPNESAVSEIRKLANTATADLMGKIPGVVADNAPLKTSKQWASFLQDFLQHDKKHGDVVRMRMLNTIEDVKTEAVKELLTNLKKNSADKDVKESAERILNKNFAG